MCSQSAVRMIELILQKYNTPLLSEFMDKHASQTLIDYELLTAPTEKGDLKRVAAFGWYAGGTRYQQATDIPS